MRSELAIGAGVVVGVVALVYVITKLRPGAFNPASDQNLAYSAGSSIVAGVTGGAASGGEDTVGGALARITETLSGFFPFSNEAKIREMQKGTPAGTTTAGGFYQQKDLINLNL